MDRPPRDLPTSLGAMVLRAMQRIRLLTKFLPDDQVTIRQDFQLKDGTTWTLRLSKKVKS